MKNKFLLTIFALTALIFGFIVSGRMLNYNSRVSGAPPYLAEDLNPPASIDTYSWLANWKRPEEPAKVGLQVGHWKSSEFPDELKRLRGNTGASGGGKMEWEVNKKIADLTAEILREKGIVVEVLPATIPASFWADVFIAIHADGSTDTSKSGYKAASPRRDYSSNAGKLLEFVEDEYQKTTGLSYDPNVTRNMRGYYAFSWWRYVHSVHPKTASVILETGFLTSPEDRKIIVNNPLLSAQGLSRGISKYLESENLLR